MSHQIIYTDNAPKPIGPYSQAILVNETLYSSGQIAINPENGELISDNIKVETAQVFENLKAVLIEAGFGFKNVVKATVFLKDLRNFSDMNEVYTDVFGTIKPARETVEVSKLPKDVNIEISVIAVR